MRDMLYLVSKFGILPETTWNVGTSDSLFVLIN